MRQIGSTLLATIAEWHGPVTDPGRPLEPRKGILSLMVWRVTGSYWDQTLASKSTTLPLPPQPPDASARRFRQNPKALTFSTPGLPGRGERTACSCRRAGGTRDHQREALCVKCLGVGA